MRNGNMDFALSSRLVEVTIFVVDAIVDTEAVVFECSNEVGRSPFVLARLSLVSVADGAVLVTVVTVPKPLTEDFTTGSSFVLSRTRSSIGIGYN